MLNAGLQQSPTLSRNFTKSLAQRDCDHVSAKEACGSVAHPMECSAWAQTETKLFLELPLRPLGRIERQRSRASPHGFHIGERVKRSRISCYGMLTRGGYEK